MTEATIVTIAVSGLAYSIFGLIFFVAYYRNIQHNTKTTWVDITVMVFSGIFAWFIMFILMLVCCGNNLAVYSNELHNN